MTEYDETSDAESLSGSALLKMGTWLRRGSYFWKADATPTSFTASVGPMTRSCAQPTE